MQLQTTLSEKTSLTSTNSELSDLIKTQQQHISELVQQINSLMDKHLELVLSQKKKPRYQDFFFFSKKILFCAKETN